MKAVESGGMGRGVVETDLGFGGWRRVVAAHEVDSKVEVLVEFSWDLPVVGSQGLAAISVGMSWQGMRYGAGYASQSRDCVVGRCVPGVEACGAIFLSESKEAACIGAGRRGSGFGLGRRGRIVFGSGLDDAGFRRRCRDAGDGREPDG